MNQESVGKFMASLRKEKKLTQEQLAEMLGVNSRSVSRWENGYCMPDFSLLPMISDELEVSVAELLNGKREGDGQFRKENAYLENYRVLAELNRKEIFAEEIPESEKQEAVSALLSGGACGEDVVRYKKRMRVNPATDKLYPDCYIPPYHGNKKLRLLCGYLPKTNLLYANHYELEIIRLLFLFAPENEKVVAMVKHTRDRLKNTCFGSSCTQGECVAAGISVLRFLAATQPDETEWMDKLLNPLGIRFLSFGNGQAAMQNGIPLSYLLMAFTEINNEKTRALIRQKKEYLLTLLRRGWITGRLSNGKISEGDSYNLMGKYILRNSLRTLPEYKDISENEIYIDATDGRCYCNI